MALNMRKGSHISSGEHALFRVHPRSRSRPRSRFDFAAINRAAIAALPAVLPRILPSGKTIGGEYVALNPCRNDKRPGSFKINLHSGRWSDFATDDAGADPVSLVAYLENVSQGEAARMLARMLGLETGGRRYG
jgi:hypothetical protein